MRTRRAWNETFRAPFWAALCVAITLCSCGPNIPETARVIPSDAKSIMSTNLPNLAFKAEVKNLRDLKFYREIEYELQDQPYIYRELFKEFTENPLVTGIDYLEDVFGFVLAESPETPHHFGLVLGMSDHEKFKTFLTRMPDLPAPEQKTGYELIQHEQFEIAFNEKVVLFMARYNFFGNSTNMPQLASDCMEIHRDSGMVADDHFIEFLDEDYDVGFFFDWKYAQNALSSEMLHGLGEGYDHLFEDNHSQVLVNFEKEYISSQVVHLLNEESAELVHFSAETGVDASFLRYMSRTQPLMAASSHVDMEHIYSLAESNPNADKLLDEIASSFNIRKEDLPGLVTGEFSFAFSDLGDELGSVNLGDYLGSEFTDWNTAIPLASAIGCVGITDKEKAEQILLRYGLEENEGLWRADFNYIVVLEDKMLATPNKEIAIELRDHMELNPYENNGLEDLHTESPVAGYLNLNLNDYPQTFNMGALVILGNSYFKRVKGFMENFDYVTIQGSLNNEMTIYTYMNDTEHNSLFQLVQGLEKAL